MGGLQKDEEQRESRGNRRVRLNLGNDKKKKKRSIGLNDKLPKLPAKKQVMDDDSGFLTF